MELIASFHFIRPYWLPLLPLLWALAWWLARRRTAAGNWEQVIDPALLPRLQLDAAEPPRLTPWPWLALAWSLAVLALAGPAWERDASPAWRAPAAWVVVLDLSPSMAAPDPVPSRVVRARYAIDDLLAAARDARVGLVVFADEAFAVTPLTEDVATVRALLPPLSPQIMPGPGDRLAPALEQAGKLLRQAGGRSRRVVLVSDGCSDRDAALDAARALRQQGVLLDVVGIGDRQGDVAVLRRLATGGGGRYAGLTGLPGLIDGLREDAAREREATAMAGISVERWREGGLWLLPPLLLLAALLGRRGWL